MNSRVCILWVSALGILSQLASVRAAPSYPPLALTLYGPNPFTNECPTTFIDPGAMARGGPVAIGAGAEHSLALWCNGTVAIWGGDRYRQQRIPTGLSNVMALAAGGYHTMALKSDGALVGWGDDSRGQATVPAGLSNVAAVAGGAEHTVALKTDGTVVAWGWNAYGQATPPTGLSNVMAISAGAVHSLALKSNGTVIAWGTGSSHGDCGQSRVPPDLSNVIAIAGGGLHSLALCAEGTVVAWGAGATNSGVVPNFGQSVIPPGLTNVIAIAAGHYHSLAVKADGTVVAWGAGTTNTGEWPDYGQALVPSNLSNVIAIAAGYDHNLAMQADGTVKAWGWNEDGQASELVDWIDLSDGINVSGRFNPNVPGACTLTYTVADLFGHTASTNRTVIVRARSAGSVDCYFDPTQYGDLGIEGDYPAPWVSALARDTDGRIYVGGTFHSVNGEPRNGLARLLSNGTLDHSFQAPWTNGVDIFALARQPDQKLVVLWRGSNYHFPAQAGGGVVRLNGDGSFDFTFENHWAESGGLPSVRALALQADGKVLVGGEFMEPRTGIARFHANGMLDETFTPPLLPAYDGTTVKAIAVQTDGKILVAGSYGIGLLRLNEDGSEDTSFQSNVEIGGSAIALLLQPDGGILVGLNGGFVGGVDCGDVIRLRPDGHLDESFRAELGIVPRCLELQPDGRILAGGEVHVQGDASEIYRLNPDGSRDATFQAWTGGGYGWPMVTTMLLEADGHLVVGGAFTSVNNLPAVGVARLYCTRSRAQVVAWGAEGTPETMVPDGLSNVVAVAGGVDHSVALKSDGRIVTWGRTECAQCDVPPGLTNVAAIAVGPYHTLAVTRDGCVVAWGDPSAGCTRVPPGLSNVIAVTAGVFYSMALRDDGSVVAWGSDLDVNDNHTGRATVPAGLANVIAIAAGDYHSVALKADGRVVCWGANDANQLAVPASLPELVAITAAANHTLGITRGGDWVGWGENCPYFIPCTNLVALASGERHGLALMGDGRVLVCEIGGPDEPYIPEALTGVTAIAAGRYHRLALVGAIEPMPLRIDQPSLVGSQFSAWAPTMANGQYVLEGKNAVTESHWTVLTNFQGYGYGIRRRLIDRVPPAAQRFYRVLRVE